MLSTSSDLRHESLQIKHNDKFSSMILSKEPNPSFRVYYGVASGAVPFVWESQPGTPKNSIPTTTLPPLTPPPSYHLRPNNNNSTKRSHKYSSLIRTILPRLSLIMRPTHVAPVSPPSSSLTGSSGTHWRSRFSSSTSSFSSLGEEEDADDGSPTSRLCFGVLHGLSVRLRGCRSSDMVRAKVLMPRG